MWTNLLALAVGVAGLCGYAGRDDLYGRMSQAARPGSGLQQTQLAHLGHVETRDGRYEVCFQRLVRTGMATPRGQAKLLLFAPNGSLVRGYNYPGYPNVPLWCEAGRVYLLGFAYVPGMAIDPDLESRLADDEVPTGNVLDFSAGLERAMLRRELKYGSSGGRDDELYPSR